MGARKLALVVLALLALAPFLAIEAGAVTPSWNMNSYYRFEGSACTTTSSGTLKDDDAGQRGDHDMIPQGGFTAANCTAVPGEYGNAWSFNGATTSFVHSPKAWPISGGNSFTIMAWVKPHSVGANGATIAGDVYNGTVFFMRLTAGTDHAHVGTYVGGGCTRIEVEDTQPIAFNSWSNVAMTYDGSFIRLYVNGIQRGQTAGSGNVCSSTGGPNIGNQYNPGIIEPFVGEIDDVRVYSVPLSATQVNTAMNDATNTPSPPAAVWHQTDPGAQTPFGAGCDVYTVPRSDCAPTPNPVAIIAGHTYYLVSGTQGTNFIVNNQVPRFDLNGWVGTSPSQILEVRYDDLSTCAQNLVVGNYFRTLFFVSNQTAGNTFSTWAACQFVPNQNYSNVSMQFTINGNGVPGSGNAFSTWGSSGQNGLIATFSSSGTPVGFLYDANSTTPPPPGNVTLAGVTACVVSPFTNTLTWSAPSSGTATGFILTRTEAWGASQTFQFGASTFTYADGATTNVRNYTVQAVNAGGASAPSNIVSLVCPTQSFFGGGSGGGAIYGLPGTRAAIQSTFGMSSDQVDTLFSIMWIFAFMFLGCLLGGMMGGWSTATGGAMLGAAFGIFWDIAALLIPPWLLIFFGVIVVAVPLGLAMLKRSKR